VGVPGATGPLQPRAKAEGGRTPPPGPPGAAEVEDALAPHDVGGPEELVGQAPGRSPHVAPGPGAATDGVDQVPPSAWVRPAEVPGHRGQERPHRLTCWGGIGEGKGNSDTPWGAGDHPPGENGIRCAWVGHGPWIP